MTDSRIFPNFLIIGANKGGTSSFYKYLDQHPEIFMSEIKEPMFFLFNDMTGKEQKQAEVDEKEPEWQNWKPISSVEEYRKMFVVPPTIKAAGEASTAYLANPVCAERIARYNPDMKIIAILRNPVSRAFSNYQMYVRLGHESEKFPKVVADELAGKRKHLPQGRHYVELGYYADSIAEYIRVFGKQNVKVYLIDELREKPEWMFADAFAFLGVDTSFRPDIREKFNVNENVMLNTTFTKNFRRIDNRLRLTSVLPASWKRALRGELVLDADTKRKLKDLYRKDILRVQELTGKDLGAWLA